MQNHLFWMLFICGHLLQKSMVPKHLQDSFFKVQSLGLQYLYLPENKFQKLGLPSPDQVCKKRVGQKKKLMLIPKKKYFQSQIYYPSYAYFFSVLFFSFSCFFLLFLPTVFCAGFTRLHYIRLSNKLIEGQRCSNQKHR